MTDYNQLSIEEKKILVYILDNEKISRKEAVDLLNLGETKIKEIFGEMLIKKLIARHGKGRSTYYIIASNTERHNSRRFINLCIQLILALPMLQNFVILLFFECKPERL